MIEPGGIIPDYTVEISDNDVEYLGITGADGTMILNIVAPSGEFKNIRKSCRSSYRQRNTLVMKQCIINNHEKYSARYVLDLADAGNKCV